MLLYIGMKKANIMGQNQKKVREYMLDADDYYLKHRKYNRSDGAKLGITYEPPEIKID